MNLVWRGDGERVIHRDKKIVRIDKEIRVLVNRSIVRFDGIRERGKSVPTRKVRVCVGSLHAVAYRAAQNKHSLQIRDTLYRIVV